MNKEKIAGALGLCRRAGKITVGAYLVKQELHRETASIVLLASDAAQNAEKKIAPLAKNKQVPLKRIPLSKEELGKCVGKEKGVVCVAVGQEFLNLVLASL